MFKAGVSDELVEEIVGSEPNTVAASLQLSTECDKWLDISAASHDLDQNVELGRILAAKVSLYALVGWRRRLGGRASCDAMMFSVFTRSISEAYRSCQLGIAINVDAAVVLCRSTAIFY